MQIVVLILIVVLLSSPIHAGVEPFSTEIGNSYYYSDHHEIVIDRQADVIWPHLRNLASWMYDFSMEHYSGPSDQDVEILRLYEGQDYFFEVTKTIRNELLLGTNLPMTTPEGESTSGIAYITLTEVEGKTVVSVFMNRKYSWLGDVENSSRTLRESSVFSEGRKTTFRRFLARLKELAEA